MPMRTPFKANNRAGPVSSDLSQVYKDPGEVPPLFFHGRATNGARAEKNGCIAGRIFTLEGGTVDR